MQPLRVHRVELSQKEGVAQWQRRQQRNERTGMFEAEDECRGVQKGEDMLENLGKISNS